MTGGVPSHSGRPTAMWTCGEQLSALERRRAHESKGMESLTHQRVREVRRPDYIKMSSAPSELMAGSSAPHLRAYICPPPRAAARLAAQSVGACAGLREQLFFYLLMIFRFTTRPTCVPVPSAGTVMRANLRTHDTLSEDSSVLLKGVGIFGRNDKYKICI